MYESELHKVLRDNPELIEPGLRFLQQEVPIGQGLRCDLLYEDIKGRKVYVEVKWIAGKRAVIQVEQYEVVRKGDRGKSRFVLAAVDAKPGIPELLARRGFEFIKIDRDSLIALRPEWKEKLRKNNIGPHSSKVRRSAIPPEINDAKLKILHKLCEDLRDEFPDIEFNHSPESRDRLIMLWDRNDYFLFDFSTEVEDGFRCAFVVDLDQENSQRRQAFQETLRSLSEEVADTLGCPVKDGIGNHNLVKEGLKSWTKISNHRRKGVHCIYRLPGIEWTDSDGAVKNILPYIYKFVERMNSLLQRYRPK
ncbi:endonuclease NucS domain-containing protein [Calderihabitans maritimus]|uniref:Endonuclease NucS C-terminal domain-containing protein n=1 Tax=Calderihabitans maritimus TaxID=1246530 RepID=A0A1Z5HXW6_9FIRM|nr:endonuclease NucS domain-containing protein [Calderihabitans maritimus]GAW94373.1 hypothetical protein KKC1_34790 [Calderihabitans maritimus]